MLFLFYLPVLSTRGTNQMKELIQALQVRQRDFYHKEELWLHQNNVKLFHTFNDWVTSHRTQQQLWPQ
jgi:hypothetical protein